MFDWTKEYEEQKTTFNEGSYTTKSPNISGGSAVWEMERTGPAITDTHVPCGYWFKDYDSDEQLRRICLGLEMGYTKTDMVVDEQQTLYVKDSNGDTVACPITVWTLSGVGSLSESVGPTTVYTAPSYSEAGSDSATITLWCGGAVKDTLVISVAHSCDCLDTIEYTSLQMYVSQQQTLSASGVQSDECYSWQITSGGGSLSASTGKSVIYTAPSSNANCSSNPTITLTYGGNVVDTLQISVNAYTNMGKVAFRQICTGGPAYNTSNCDNQGEYPICYVSFRVYDCLGRDMRALNGYPDETCFIAMYEAQQGGPDSCINSACADVDPGTPGCSCGWVEGVLYDVRTPDMITGGCCPAALI